MKRVTKEIIDELYESLHYLHMSELKKICMQLKCSTSGLKAVLIEHIITFLKTGKETLLTLFPDNVQAKRGIKYPLLPGTKILYGAYKNDLRTRLFFKKLIGPHFHFTAFGQDWIKERWLAGKPPTYAEFAQFWQKEYEKRKKQKAQPKQEWAYLSFIQRYTKEYPGASRMELVLAWKKIRVEKVKMVDDFLAQFKKS